MLVFFLSLACGPKKEVQTPVEMPKEVSVSEEVVEPEVPEPLPPAFPSNVDFQVQVHSGRSSFVNAWKSQSYFSPPRGVDST